MMIQSSLATRMEKPLIEVFAARFNGTKRDIQRKETNITSYPGSENTKYLDDAGLLRSTPLDKASTL